MGAGCSEIGENNDSVKSKNRPQNNMNKSSPTKLDPHNNDKNKNHVKVKNDEEFKDMEEWEGI